MIRVAVLSVLLLVSAPALAQDMPLTQVLIPGENWELIAEGYKFTEGPAVDRQGNVFFVDVPASRIYRIDLSGKVTLFAENTARTAGLMFGPDDRLYAGRIDDQKIVAYDMTGKMEIIAEGIRSNDLVVASDGGIYITDPRGKRVWYIGPDRKKRVVATNLRPNGIILTADEGTLVVTDGRDPVLWAFRVEKDGSLTHGSPYYHPIRMPPGAKRTGSDGMTVDTEGRLYVTTLAGLQMFDPTGRSGGLILKPQNKSLANVVFGGPGLHYLYVTSTDKVYRRKVKPTGAPYFLRAKKKR